MRTSRNFIAVLAGGLLFLAAGGPAPARGDDTPALRVVVLTKATADGQNRDAGTLEAWTTGALQAAGHRVVSLDASLRAQAFALADAVGAGQVPDALTTLNADAAWSVRLECDRDAGHRQVVGLTWHCTLHRNVVRIGSGDMVFAESVSWHDIMAANPGQALSGGNVRNRAPPLLAEDLASWTGAWQDDGPWDVDLSVTLLTSRQQAETLAERLGVLPGVSSSRLATFSRTVSHFVLRGEGRDALDRLAEHVEGDASLGLVVTHQTDRRLHAELDVGRMHRRGARILVVPPADTPPKSMASLVAETGPDLVRAALANLSWLEPERIVAGSPTSAAPRSRLLREARQAGDPYLVVVAFRSARESGGADRWLVTASLVTPADGTDLLSASGQDADPVAALDGAVRALDRQFVTAAADSRRRPRLGLPAEAGEAAVRAGVEVTGFELEPLFPTRARQYQTDGIGTLTIRNQAQASMVEGRLEIRAGGHVLATLDVPDLASGETASIPVRLDVLPDVDPEANHTLPAQATVSFQVGESFGRARAYATLRVHRRNTLDWNEAESVAAFVDATDSAVRSLATAALSGGLPDGVPRALARAAAVHASLWGPPLHYVADPVATAFQDSIDDVQHPRETLQRLAGDCDDLTVLLASLYESVGLSTAILTTPGHVLLGVDSGLLAGGHLLVGLPADRFVQVDGALFVPLETTALSADFAEAWRLGAEMSNGAGESLHAFRTRDAWRRFPTAAAVEATEARLSARPVENAALAALLPRLQVPAAAPDGTHALAKPVLTWLSGAPDDGALAAAEACGEGTSEACFNLAVMLAASSDDLADEPFPPIVTDALSLLPDAVVTMFLDHGGLGMGDDASEASAQADTRRRLEEVLRRARERQAETEAEGMTDTRLRGDPMAGRRGRPVNDPVSFAPLFFYGPAGDS